MRKEYYEMLVDVIKTASDSDPILKTAAVLENYVMATDAKRALRITTESPVKPDGLYQIAKVGKVYQLVASSEPGRYPDIERIMKMESKEVLDIACTATDTKTGKTGRLDPDYFPGRLLTILGRLQTMTDAADVSTLNYAYLSVVAKKMFALADGSIRVEYIGPTYPVKLSCRNGRDTIEYIIMPMSF